MAGDPPPPTVRLAKLRNTPRHVENLQSRGHPGSSSMGASLRMTPTLSLPLSGGGKSEPLVWSFGLMAEACRLLHPRASRRCAIARLGAGLPLKGGGRREA